MPFNRNFDFMDDFKDNDGFLKGFLKKKEVIMSFAVILLGLVISAYCSIIMKNLWLTIIGTIMTISGSSKLAKFIHIAAQKHRECQE